MKIKMFTKTVCPTCKIAKKQLTYVPVPVEIEEINIEDDTPFYDFEGNLIELKVEYMMEKLESMSTPTFLFENGIVVRGYEEGELRTALGL